jgi:GDPmannose 4,6-dehydratase
VKGLIFGANGQDGPYLSAELHRRGIEPVGVSRSGDWIRGDVASFAEVDAVIRDHRPDYVFQLAAHSTTRHEALFPNHEAISTGAWNVLESVHRHCPLSRVLLPGSGVQFQNTGRPINEDTPFHASSPYAVARIQSVYAARYFRRLGLRCYIGYLFHHESPRRTPDHVSMQVATAARRIAQGSDETLDLGDLSVRKEWTYAGDVVNAMLLLMEQDEVFEAVIGSGQAHSIEEWVECCFRIAGLDWRDHVRIRDGFVAEYPTLVSDPARINSLGWRPRVGFEELAAIMMQGE